MNPTLLLGFARQRLTSPVRLVFLAFMLCLPLLIVFAAPGMGLQPFKDVSGLVLLFAAGLIGQDVSSGVLHLLLARPVSRAEYVVSRWLGASLLASAVVLLQIGVGCAILVARGAAPGMNETAYLLGEHLLRCFGISAVIVFFSSFMGGIGDIGVYFITLFSSFIAAQIGTLMRRVWLQRIGEEVQGFLGASIPLTGIPHGDPVTAFAVVSYLSTIALCLALAIVILNRKELSYASG
jgi:ABC-type transport system involved in multi-copper enzyme maturation permease subunit